MMPDFESKIEEMLDKVRDGSLEQLRCSVGSELMENGMTLKTIEFTYDNDFEMVSITFKEFLQRKGLG